MCGYCGTQFNALENLSDFPSNTPNVAEADEEVLVGSIETDLEDTIEEETIVSFSPVDERDMEPPQAEPRISSTEFVKPKTERDKVLDLATAASILESAKQVEVEKEFILSEPDSEQEEETLDELIQDLTSSRNDDDDYETELQQLSNQQHDEIVEIDEPILHDPYPAEFLEEEHTPGVFSILFWRGLALLLLLIAALQFVWYQRDILISDYPQTVSYLKKACDLIGCSIHREQDFSKIKLTSRDVRLHPGYQDSLLVNAVMMNQAETMMPYPNIQLSLFDTNGMMVSYRQFAPEEYLDKNINIAAGMKTQSPVHFVLELAGHVESAVSFEFDFY